MAAPSRGLSITPSFVNDVTTAPADASTLERTASGTSEMERTRSTASNFSADMQRSKSGASAYDDPSSSDEEEADREENEDRGGGGGGGRGEGADMIDQLAQAREAALQRSTRGGRGRSGGRSGGRGGGRSGGRGIGGRGRGRGRDDGAALAQGISRETSSFAVGRESHHHDRNIPLTTLTLPPYHAPSNSV